MRTIVFGIIGLLLAAMVPLRAQNAEIDVPYIYYYSDEMRAFVVERADGTDRHILGDGLVEELKGTRFFIDVPGWSPSGEWFAWTANYAATGGGGFLGARPYVVKADGSRRLTMLDDIGDSRIAWSPHEDILLVASREVVIAFTEEESYGRHYFGMVDVASETPIAVIDERFPFDEMDRWNDRPSPTARWINDGEYGVIEYYNEDFGNEQQSQTYILLIDRDGNISEKVYQGVIYNEDRLYYPEMPVSANGHIIYLDDNSIVLEDVVTGEQYPLDVRIDTVHWSPNGEYALLDGATTYLLDVSGVIPSVTRLPANFVESYSYFYDHDLWSPNSQHAAFTSDRNTLYYLSADTHELTQLLSMEPSDNAIFVWLDDGKLVLSVNHYDYRQESPVYSYDFDESMEPQTTYSVGSSYYSPAIPNAVGNYLAYVSEGAVIFDMQQQSYLRLPPDSDSWFSDTGGKINWHPDGEWFLIFESAIVADTCCGFHLGISRYDGTMHREVAYTVDNSPSRIVYDWLPARIDVDQLPPAIPQETPPQPVQTLLGDEWTFYLSWSPDGTQLVSTFYHYREGDYYLWNLQSGERLPLFENRNSDWIAWHLNEDGHYEPQRVRRGFDIPADQYRAVLAVSPDENWAVAWVEGSGIAAVYELETERKIVDLDFADWNTVQSASFSPDSQFLAVGYVYHRGQIWDTRTWEVVAELPTVTPAVAFSPDGTLLAASRSWNIDIWRVEDLLGANEGN